MNGKAIYISFIIFLVTANSFAQSKNTIKIPGRKEIVFKFLLAQMNNKEKSNSQQNKPTGQGQRLVRTIAQVGSFGGPYYTSNEILYDYSGIKATHTLLHGVYPISSFDNAHCLNNTTYATQLFNATGNLQTSTWYLDNSFAAGSGAGDYYIKQYDNQNRLILDSTRQFAAPNNGQNLALVTKHLYDSLDKQIYYSDAWIALDSNGTGNSYSNWTFYNSGDSLPQFDSIVDFDITVQNVTTTKHSNHYYDINGRLINDSIYVYGSNGQKSLKERNDYSYPFQGCQQEVTYTLSSGVWIPQYRLILEKDIFGRITNNQGEVYENGIWNKFYKNTFEFTFNTQPDSLPTVFTVYNNDNINWVLSSKEVRTFNDDQMVDTLYSYYYEPNSSGYGFVAYNYNDFNNLTQDYHHYFLNDGTEINGYYTNFYYELAIPLGTQEILDNRDNISVYPNPTKDFICIKQDKALGKLGQFFITNSMGQMLSSGSLKTSNKLDVSTIPSGIYFITIFDRNNIKLGTKIWTKQ